MRQSQENIEQSINLELENNNNAIIGLIVKLPVLFLCHVGRYYVTLFNRELVNRVKLCLVSVSPDIVKASAKIRNLPKIFLRCFKNVGPGAYFETQCNPFDAMPVRHNRMLLVGDPTPCQASWWR